MEKKRNNNDLGHSSSDYYDPGDFKPFFQNYPVKNGPWCNWNKNYPRQKL